MRCSEKEEPEVQRGSQSQIRDTRDATRDFNTVGMTAQIIEQTDPQQELKELKLLFFFCKTFLQMYILCVETSNYCWWKVYCTSLLPTTVIQAIPVLRAQSNCTMKLDGRLEKLTQSRFSHGQAQCVSVCEQMVARPSHKKHTSSSSLFLLLL